VFLSYNLAKHVAFRAKNAAQKEKEKEKEKAAKAAQKTAA